MRFQVPQFIEIEDKIFGPLTLKQFIYLAGSAGLCVVFFLFLNKWIAIVPSLIVVGFGLMLAFFKVNNRPFVVFVESLFTYIVKPKLYIWHKEDKIIIHEDAKKETPDLGNMNVPSLSNSRLKELSWSLDTRSIPNNTAKDDGLRA